MCLVGRIYLRFGLCHASLRLHQAGVGGGPGIFSAIEIRFRNEAVLIQILRPLPVQLVALIVRLGALHVSLRSLQCGIRRQFVCLRRL